MLTTVQNSDVPKHVAIRQAIRKQIEEGRYRVGERIPSEVALAKQAGVARMTVRQAVSELVHEGVLERRHGSGTFVREPRAHRNLALLFFNTSDIHKESLAWSELNTVRSVALKEQRQFRAMLMMPPYQEPRELARELGAMDVGVAGLINFTAQDSAYIAALKCHLPCVLINKELPGVVLPCAKPNTHSAAERVVDYFVARGRSRIGLMVGNIGHPLHLEIALALEGELHRRGLPIEKAGWFEGRDPSEGAKGNAWIAKMLPSRHRPDALLLVCDSEWPSAIRAGLHERGERLGDTMDLVVYGANDPDWARLSLNHTKVVRNALRLMRDMADGSMVRGTSTVLLSKASVAPPESHRRRTVKHEDG